MKIAIIQARPGIGDMCIFLPFIHAIAKFFNTKIFLITKARSHSKELLKFDPYIEEIIYLDESNLLKLNYNLIKVLKKRKINKIFLMHFGLRYWVLSKLSGVKKIYSYGLIKKKVNITGYIKYIVNKWLGAKNLKFPCKIFFDVREKKNSIVIGIGGSGTNKKWKISNYIELIKLINQSDNEKEFIIAGGINEKNDFTEIKNNLPNISCKSLCDLKISQCLEIISTAKLYIGNDTGFMHICGSLSIPAFGIFGNTPSNYCDYNSMITPIMPKGYSQVNYDDNVFDKILPVDIFKILKDRKCIS